MSANANSISKLKELNALRRARTTCKLGHPLHQPAFGGQRRCKICRAAALKRYRTKHLVAIKLQTARSRRAKRMKALKEYHASL